MKPPCYFCGCPCQEDDFCSGCDEFICDDCDETHPMGPHDPEDHLTDNAEG
jgi:hypothetical protein